MTLARRSRYFLPQELCAAALLCIPFWIFVVVILLLGLQHGGHRFANLDVNPYCRLPISQNTSHGANPAVTVLLHISDLHVNDVDGGRAKRNLRTFQTEALPRWAPVASALLVSGDLVNSVSYNRYPFGAKSVQLVNEWRWLGEFVAEVTKSVPWIAAYGNHDTFGTSLQGNPHAPICAASGEAIRKTVLHNVGAGAADIDLSVLALDCTLPNPLHRPLNFFGNGRRAASQLRESLAEGESRGEGGMAVAFGHYPSAVMAGGRDVHEAAVHEDSVAALSMPRFAAFLSGHLHTLKGLAPAGLQAVSKTGVLELQLPDMVESGAFRVLAFDGGSVSFKDFSVRDKGRGGLDDVMVTNLPRAGLCSAGAGTVARQSSHVHIVGPEDVMTGRELEVRIDGEVQGTASTLASACETEKGKKLARSRTGLLAKCVPVYGVPWNASMYDDGRLHTLSIHADGEQSAPYVFSLDGAPEPGWKSRRRRLVSAIFSLSDFEKMASSLCSTGFLFCFMFCIPGLLRRQVTTVTVVFVAFSLRFGPAFIIAGQLTDADTGIGMAGLRYIRLPSSVHPAGVDCAYVMSVSVLYGTLIPVSYFDTVSSSRASHYLRHAKVTPFFALLYILRSLSWCLEVFGAHGFLAGLVSPSCTPLLVAVTLSILASSRKLRKKNE